jgi:hypothetical protein
MDDELVLAAGEPREPTPAGMGELARDSVLDDGLAIDL